MIKRAYEPLERYLQPNKVLVIYGPRRTGKTTLLGTMLSGSTLKYKLASGDDLPTQHVLSSQDFRKIIPFVEGYQLFALDEAQHVPNVGMGLKIIADQAGGRSRRGARWQAVRLRIQVVSEEAPFSAQALARRLSGQ
ncbi:MAG: AAA family ATPase [Acidobacteriota bacterium]